MKIAGTASYDASHRTDFVPGDNEVLWLQPRHAAAADVRWEAPALRSLRRLMTSLCVGVACNLWMVGIAFAPSALAEDVASFGASVEPAPHQADAVEGAPIMAMDATPGAPDRPATRMGLECDESEMAEMHRSDVRRLLAQGLSNPKEPIEFGGVKVPRRLVETVLRASEVTGVDPVYMMALADKESSFSVDVKASTSSAEGLFQFIVKTWLEVVREFGPRHGLHAEASAIETVDGELKVADDLMRERVLGLRRDPYFSAVMAAELLKKDRASISQKIGRELRQTEFYLAHFFGVQGAGRFMKLLDGKPQQSAPRVFPHAAKANKPLFFSRKGKKTKDLSVAEVYAKIDRMIDTRIGRYRAVTRLTLPESLQPSI